MCRFAGMNYKEHHACFRCRKMFRQPSRADLRHARPPAYGEARSVPCPECGETMHDMGPDFKAPRQNELKQWAKVEILFRHGFTFHSCGCGPGLRPAELREVEAFLADHLPQSEGDKLLRKISASAARARKRRQLLPGQSAGDHPLAGDARKLRRPGEAAAIAASLLRKKR